MADAPVSGGPRLGKLQGLRKEENDDPQGKNRPRKKEGIKILPLVLLCVMFGPVLLTGLIYVMDKVANSEWAVNLGLAKDPRQRLMEFYQIHNPNKMREVDKLIRMYKGRYEEMFAKLESKYKRLEAHSKEEEEYRKEEERYEREAREAMNKFD